MQRPAKAFVAVGFPPVLDERLLGFWTQRRRQMRFGQLGKRPLRIVAQESRDHRMMVAEKKAAALPPKLTVPMILFFLPVLFAVILTPAIIQINHTAS